jgi:uncharacterized membrane protein YkoI
MRSLGLLVLVAACAGQEATIALSDVPPPVMSAIRDRFAQATAVAASRETKDGRTLYEVTLKSGTRQIDVTSTAEGELIEVEGGLTENDLPAAVTNAISVKYPGAKYRIVEDVKTSDPSAPRSSYFEVLLETTNKRFVEVQIAADGTILKEEKKAGPES